MIEKLGNLSPDFWAFVFGGALVWGCILFGLPRWEPPRGSENRYREIWRDAMRVVLVFLALVVTAIGLVWLIASIAMG